MKISLKERIKTLHFGLFESKIVIFFLLCVVLFCLFYFGVDAVEQIPYCTRINYAWSPDGKRIAYMPMKVYDRIDHIDDLLELWIMNDDGSEKKKLAVLRTTDGLNRSREYQDYGILQWSNDGKEIWLGHTKSIDDVRTERVIFFSTDGNERIWKRDFIAGSIWGAYKDEVLVAREVEKTDDIFRDEKYVLSLVNVADGSEKLISSHKFNIAYPWDVTLSPDGRRIALLTTKMGGVKKGADEEISKLVGACDVQMASWILWIEDKDSSATEKIFTFEEQPYYKPPRILWMPDSRRIIISSTHIWTLSIDRKREQKVLAANIKAGEMALSPDGKKLCYTDGGNLYIYSFASGKNEAILKTKWPFRFYEISWKPGGSEIAFIKGRAFGDLSLVDLYTVNCTTKKVRSLTTFGDKYYLTENNFWCFLKTIRYPDKMKLRYR